MLELDLTKTRQIVPCETSPVPVTVLQVCEGLVEKVIQVKPHTIPSTTAFRGH